jgi:hypothetical protein
LYAGNPGLWGGSAGFDAGLQASLYLNFLAGAPLDSRVTFTRGSNATLVDSTGKITYAPANLLLRSEEFDSGTWSKSNSTVTANATTAPNGTTTADKLIENATANIHFASQSITALSPASNSYMVSAYVKAGERNYVTLGLSDISVGSRYAVAVFDLNTGATMTTGAQGTGYAVSNATTVAVGNGWYRCSVYCTAGTTVSFLAAAVGVNQTGVITGTTAGGFQSYTGDGTSGIFVWGAQLEPVTYQTTPSTYVATTTAAYYGPRFDYDPVTLAAKGLLIEEQRTNLVLQSQTFDAASWTKDAGAVTANATTAPDGTSTADKFVATATTAFHGLYQSVTGTVASYTYSVYAKAAEYSKLQLANGSGGTWSATFDLATGATIATGGTAVLSSNIQSVGNGWYRCAVTFTGAAANTAHSATGYPNTGATLNNFGASYTGDGTSGIFLWGAQLEAGSFATSYIPTVASQVTRSADNASMTGTNFSSWYNQTEGTFATQVSLLNISSGHLLTAFQGYSDLMRIRPLSSIPTANITVGGVSQFDSTSQGSLGAITTNEIFSSALAYKQNDTSFAAKGVSVPTDTSVTLVAAPSRLAIGSLDNSGSGNMSGHIRSITYYNTRLSNATLVSLTA